MTVRFSASRFVERFSALGGVSSREIHVLDEIDSTSSDLKRRLKSGARSDTVVVAHCQLQGRGRLGRVWHSPMSGNLCFSAALDIGGPTDQTVPLLPLAAGIAAHEAVTEAGATVALKWPNDVLIQGRKLGGILCEIVKLTKSSALAAVGLGVNIADEPFPLEIATTAVSLNAVLGKEADISLVAARFLYSLECWNRRITAGARAEVVSEWRSRAETFGRRVKIGEITGKTIDIASDGRLILQEDTGNEIRISGGIVEFPELF